MRYFIILYVVLFISPIKISGQRKLQSFQNNADFQWKTDTIDTNVVIYFEQSSYAEKHKDVLKKRIKHFLNNTVKFIGDENYNNSIHYFILDSRNKMKQLIGYEANGVTFVKDAIIAAVFSESVNAVYSHHELFHLIAANSWGTPKIWVNEGMAVFADNRWRGYDLHQLSKFLIDRGNYISINDISKNFKKYDSMVTYPLLGSFVKFIDETYGRDTLKILWRNNSKKIEKRLGKSVLDLENEWLKMLDTITYTDIDYP